MQITEVKGKLQKGVRPSSPGNSLRYLDDIPLSQYHTFYFSPHNIKLKEVLSKIKFGAVSLHNSWTPDSYKNLTLDEVIENNSMLSTILRYALTDFLIKEGIFVKNGYLIRKSSKIGRNDNCPSNNGKKYKNCCGS
jgi:hypothetical protein